jgi:hypothetical protein
MNTKHHVIPKSRQKGKPMLGICVVEKTQHELYHHLFGNMIPEEICEFLNITFWKNEYEIEITKKGKKK